MDAYQCSPPAKNNSLEVILFYGIVKTLLITSFLVSWKWLRSQVTLRRREGGKGSGLGAEEDTRNIFAHHRNSEGQMFESFKTPETWICYSGQWQQGLSEGAPGMSRAITPPFCPSISHLHIAYT